MVVYLITGGAGFIGSHFVEYLLRSGRELKVVNIDKLTYAGDTNNLAAVSRLPQYFFYQADICDAEQMSEIFAEHRPDYVVNFAAETHVDRSIKDSQPFVRTNVLGTHVLLECARKFTVRKYYQVSTDEVYGSSAEGDTAGFTEEAPLRPSSPYAASKAAADLLTLSFFRTYQLPVIIGRSTNNYGPRQHREKLIPLVIEKCLQREEIPLYGDGKNLRDWLYVEDHCRAIDLLLAKGCPGEIYNISAGCEIENIKLIKLIMDRIVSICRQKGQEFNGQGEELIRLVSDRQGHDRRYFVDSSRLRFQLGWKTKTELLQGLTNTINWFLEQGGRQRP